MATIVKLTFITLPTFGNSIRLVAHNSSGNTDFEETFVTTRTASGQCELKPTVIQQALNYTNDFISDFGANFDLANFNITCSGNEVTIECKQSKLYDYWNEIIIDGSFVTYELLDPIVPDLGLPVLSESINKSINNISPYVFKLWFKKDNVVQEIEEPYGFDAFSHGVERKKDGWALDVHLFAENTDLLFTNSTYQESTPFEDIDGIMMFNLDHALKRIIDSYETYGADGEIELQIFFEDELLTKCDFDLEDIDSDLESYFKCGFIENNIRSKHKINENDVMINVYADRDLDGKAIDKLIPSKVLLKSKPSLAVSKWIKTDIPYGDGAPGDVTNKFPAGSGYDYFNFSKNPIIYGIDDSLEPSPLEYSNEFSDTYDGTMKFINAKSTKQNLKIKVICDVKFKHKQNGRTGWPNKSSLGLYLRFSTGPTLAESVLLVPLHFKEFVGTTTQWYTFPTIFEYEYPNILNDGMFVTLYWHYSWDSGTIALNTDYDVIDNYSHVVFNDCVVEASCIETSINSVIQGVRWIDLLKQSAKINSGLPVDAPRIDVGGEYYDTICSNGGGIRNIDGIPFNVKCKDVFEMGMMVAMDYQITENDIKIGDYNDFHGNKLIRRFNVKPDEKFYWNTNKSYRIRTFNYNFQKYEQDRAEQRTLDAVHTEEQILTPNKKTTASKEVKIKQILDAYNIDSLRALGVNPETEETSLEDDTTIVMLKVRNLIAGHQERYIGLMNISTIPGGIKIYSSNYRWDKIGLGLSSIFQILTGINTGNYVITAIDKTLLTLQTLSPIINHSESKIITIQYTLEGVTFISETTEGFADIQGVLSPETYTNLFYSKLRNIQKWLPYLATCSMRYINDLLKISFLKSNQSLSTRLYTEISNLVEHDDIPIASIANKKKVTDRTFKVNIFPENPTDMKQIFTELNVRNDDGTIGGYYEFEDITGDIVKGYINKLEYVPNDNKLEAECIEKYDIGDGFINILTADRDLYSQFDTYGIYVTIYKANGTSLVVGKRFTKIMINDIMYTDINIFVNDLQYYFSS